MCHSGQQDWWIRGPLVVSAIFIPQIVHGHVYFTGIGQLPNADAFVSLPSGISGNGQVVVGEARNNGNWEAFRWTLGGGIVGLGSSSQGSAAYAASWDGSVVVGTAGFPARWTELGGLQSLGQLPGSGTTGGLALGVSQDGSTVVGEQGGRPFRWTQVGGMQPLAFSGSSSFPTALSADGSIIVGSGTMAGNGFQSALVWTGSGVNVISGLGSYSGGARDISGDGLTIVGWTTLPGNEHAFRWTQSGGVQIIGPLNPEDASSQALACSNDGSIVVDEVAPLPQSERLSGRQAAARATSKFS